VFTVGVSFKLGLWWMNLRKVMGFLTKTWRHDKKQFAVLYVLISAKAGKQAAAGAW
jgi:hypothetical protein